jgi:hypothetical protein
MTAPAEKKLLVLDMNGLLVETFHRAEKRPKELPPDGKAGKNQFGKLYQSVECGKLFSILNLKACNMSGVVLVHVSLLS